MFSPNRTCWIHTLSLLFSLPFSFSLLAQSTKQPSVTSEKQKLLQERDRLYKEADQFVRQRKSTEALTKLDQVLKLEREVYGPTHEKVIRRTEDIAILAEYFNDWERAKRALEEVLKIQSKQLGEAHWKTQDAQRAIRDLAQRKSLTAQERQQLRMANTMNHHVLQLNRAGRYKQALALAHRVVNIRRQLLGEKHPTTISGMNNLAMLLDSQGEPKKALALLKKVLKLHEEVYGKQHPHYAETLNNLASLYSANGDFGTALSVHQAALTLKKGLLGEKHPSYAQSLNNVAASYLELGEYNKALPLYQQAASLFKEVVGIRHPHYAACLSGMANLLHEQGAYSRALPLAQQALALKKEVLGEKHPSYANSLSHLGALYRALGDSRKAVSLYEQALALRKEIYGTRHPVYALALNNAGVFYEAVGEYDKALPLFTQAVALDKELLGERHPQYTRSLNNLASLYRSREEYSKALPLFKQVIALKKEILGETHPAYTHSLNDLAGLHYNHGKYQEAEKWFLIGAKAFQAQRVRIAQEGLQRASRASEQSPLRLLAGILANNGKPKEAWHWFENSLGRATFDEVVARKNRSHDEQQQLDQLRGTIQRTEVRLKQLASRPRLSEEQQQLQQRKISEQTRNYKQLSALYNQLENKYGITEGKSYSLEQIQATLPKETAFLAWIDARDEHWAVLLPAEGVPHFQRLNAKTEDWTTEDSLLPEKVYALLRTPQKSDGLKRKTLLQELKQQRIAPIEKQLKDIKHVIVLPSRLMDKIPIEVLFPEKKVSRAPSATMYTYLRQLQKPKSAHLLALGDPIFNPQEELKEKPLPESGILITSVVNNAVADKAGLQANQVLLNYAGTPLNNLDALRRAMTSTQGKKEVRITIWDEGNTFEKVIPAGSLGVVLAKEPAKVALQNRRKQYWQLVSRGEDWSALPGTRAEVASIANLVDESRRLVLLDSSASEQRLHQLASADKLKAFKYLHFATHGQVHRSLPMESALILSRDNLNLNAAKLQAVEPYFDGRLTAKEVALYWQLDSELVTLSACNSALGKHATGEGYMGFAQSFLIRGSRSVVLSLWSVDDTATALLMKRFYENLIKKKMPKLKALREAKIWLRTLPRSEVLKLAASMSNGIARGPGRKKLPPLSKVPENVKDADAPYAHPYYWSAFILIGDPH